ncbi:MAG: hypothetical protein GX868_05300 [Actinobacteria bacterium]|nr:hypothetical protein [Actinomycetota bacterium]
MRQHRTHGARWFAGAALMALVGLIVGAVPSGAEVADETAPLQVVGIDARGGGVSVDYISAGEPAGEVTVEVDGNRYTGEPRTLNDVGVVPGVMAVIDSSGLVSNATMRLAAEDLAQLAPSAGGIGQLGVVTTGNGARLAGKPSATYDGATANLSYTKVGGQSSLWDAIIIAAKAQGTSESIRRHVVVVAASIDDGSSAEYSTVIRELRNTNTMVHVIEVAGQPVDGGALRELVATLGGTYQSGTDAEFAPMFERISAAIAGERRVTIDQIERGDGELSTLRLTVGDQTVAAGFRPGVVATTAEGVRPTPVQAGSTDSFFTSDIVQYLIIAIAAVAAGGVVFSVAMLVSKRRDNLNYALRYYDESYDGTAGVEEPEESSASATALLQRAVNVTESLTKGRGVLDRVEALLERADLPLRPAEALTFYTGGALTLVLAAAFVTRDVMIMLVVLLLAAVVPGFAVDFMAKRRKKKFTAMLPDMLTLLAGTLRAGYSIGQGIEAVSNEIDDPMGKELRRAVTEARLGRPLDEALEGIAVRLDSDDFGWAVMAIRIQREVGGNLAELLMTVADTMVQRERLRRDVASLTAEGKMSAIILGLLPPGLAFAMWVMNPGYISTLFSGTGLFLLGASIVMMIIGFVWMKKTITIEV